MKTRAAAAAAAVPARPGTVAPQTRRHFLRNISATLAAGGIAGAPQIVSAATLGRGGWFAPSNRVAIGVVGANSGLARAREFLRFPQAEIVAVCDVDERRAANAAADLARARKGTAPRLFKDFRDLFAGAAADAVIIATPDHWHGIMGIAALRAGLDVFGETPLARSHAECKAIAETARLHGRVWQCIRRRVTFRGFRRAALLVRTGILGTVTHVEIGVGDGSATDPRAEQRARAAAAAPVAPPARLDYENWVGPGEWRPYNPVVVAGGWRRVACYGGGAFAGLCEHYLDFAQGALGMEFSGPVKVSASADYETVPPYDAESRVRLDVLYETGVTLALSSDFAPGVRFHGEHGWLHAGCGNAAAGDDVLGASSPEILARATSLETEAESRRRLRSGDNIWRDFLACVAGRGRTISAPRQARRSATVWQLGRVSALTGRTLRWDARKEEIIDDEGADALFRPAFRRPWQL
ncbi:MAG: Gfo/Idh/MocA family oxidoreductase [Puniceicoccales bacterium]|jgi:predicted dehydrogenase|nr:Gfo/Idh/MocA family oxidoreductase [Puniceicoccales bacterium]